MPPGAESAACVAMLAPCVATDRPLAPALAGGDCSGDFKCSGASTLRSETDRGVDVSAVLDCAAACVDTLAPLLWHIGCVDCASALVATRAAGVGGCTSTLGDCGARRGRDCAAVSASSFLGMLWHRVGCAWTLCGAACAVTLAPCRVVDGTEGAEGAAKSSTLGPDVLVG
eukprot:5449815-Amphidinium_carterae.1